MSPPVPIGFYRVVNWASKTCLDVENDKPAKGTPLVGWKVDESRTSQVWRLTSDSVLTHVNTGLKLAEDPAAAQPENDVAIVLNDAPGMWVYNPGTEAGTWVFKVYNVNYFMDLESGSDENGTSVRIWKRPDNNPQPQNLWTFQPAKDPKGGDKPDDNGGSTGGGPASDPDTLTNGIYRIRNLGSHTLLDHFAVGAEAGAGTEVKTFFDTQNPSQEWYVTVSGATATIRNLVTGLYLQGGSTGAAAKAGTTSTSFTVTLSKKPQKGWTVVANGVALHETAGRPTDGSTGTPLAVKFANIDNDEILNQRWWFTPVQQWEQAPLPGTSSFLVRAVQTQWAWSLSGDMRVRASLNSNQADQAAFQWTAQLDKSSGTYSIVSKKFADVYLALSPRTMDPTPTVTYLAGADKQWATKWLVRSRSDRTVSFTAQGWNYQLSLESGGAPNVQVSLSTVDGNLKYNTRWVIETL